MTGLAALTTLMAWQVAFPLTDALSAWKNEIEAKLGAMVRIVEVPGGELAEEDRAVLDAFLANPAFWQAFERSQALTLRTQGRPFVLLNLAKIRATRNEPLTLIAHELGHLWLQSEGKLPPRFTGGARACLAVHIGDIVQHELMRREMDRRGIAWRAGYAMDYEAAWEASRRSPPGGAGDECLRAQRLSLMVDIRWGFPESDLEWRNGYLGILGMQDPEAEAAAIELVEALDAENYGESLKGAEDAVFRLVGR